MAVSGCCGGGGGTDVFAQGKKTRLIYSPGYLGALASQASRLEKIIREVIKQLKNEKKSG